MKEIENFNAKQANALFKSNRVKYCKKFCFGDRVQFNTVIDKIKRLAKKGCARLDYGGVLNSAVEKKLKELGYRVSYNYDNGYGIVEWNDSSLKMVGTNIWENNNDNT